MYLQQLSVINFKNYTEAEITFSDGVNVFTGNNGAGKTNLLDAIHYLSLCKSYFNPIDSQQIKQGTDFFIINGVFNKNGNTEAIACGVKRNQKKQFKRHGDADEPKKLRMRDRRRLVLTDLCLKKELWQWHDQPINTGNQKCISSQFHSPIY